MCYNGYNYNQYESQHHYPYPDNYRCDIYPIPFMPVNPQYAHAYIPYQQLTTTFPLEEALNKGTLFPELWNLYNPHANYWKEEK